MKFLSNKFFLSLLSSVLLVLAFPRPEVWPLAWIGLVPLFFALEKTTLSRAYLLGYLCGLGFFAGTLFWVIHVTMLGVVLAVLYFANYFAVFALGYVFFEKRRFWEKLFLYPSVWVASEFVRSKLFSGFGWASLGYSQYQVIPVIQIADITGMLGVSFLVVMVNVLVKGLWAERGASSWTTALLNFRGQILAVAGILLFVLAYGTIRMQPQPPQSKIKIAVVQADIAQEIKWDPRASRGIMQKYLYWTKMAAAKRPDLIIWPETAFPGYVWDIPEIFEDLKETVKKMQIPLLLGMVTRDTRYFNSALLLSADGKLAGQYNKLHLVPFGEYIPLRRWIPIIADFLPIEDFTPGKEYTLFPAQPLSAAVSPDLLGRYSVLICFEDTIPGIAREYARQGANFLVNITNDAWFKDTNEPFLHLQGAVFRSVETRRSLVRVANTGVSCFIDPKGKIYQSVRDEKGKKTYVSGIATAEVGLENGQSFYTKWGDLFTYLCFGCLLYGLRFRKD